MAKKKSKKKTHKPRKQTAGRAASTPSTPVSSAIAAESAETKAAIVSPVNVSAPQWAYVKKDITRIGILVAGFVGLEIVLWYLLNHTGVGPTIYNLIKTS